MAHDLQHQETSRCSHAAQCKLGGEGPPFSEAKKIATGRRMGANVYIDIDYVGNDPLQKMLRSPDVFVVSVPLLFVKKKKKKVLYGFSHLGLMQCRYCSLKDI